MKIKLKIMKHNRQTQRKLVQVSSRVARHSPNRWLYKKIGEKYFVWIHVEVSNDKNKRRKANKIARKQRKINNKN